MVRVPVSVCMCKRVSTSVGMTIWCMMYVSCSLLLLLFQLFVLTCACTSYMLQTHRSTRQFNNTKKLLNANTLLFIHTFISIFFKFHCFSLCVCAPYSIFQFSDKIWHRVHYLAPNRRAHASTHARIFIFHIHRVFSHWNACAALLSMLSMLLLWSLVIVRLDNCHRWTFNFGSRINRSSVSTARFSIHFNVV